MTPEEQNARIEELEELFAAQRKALVALLAVIDEQSAEEIKHAIHELLWQAHDLWSTGQVRDLCFVVAVERAPSQSSINWEGERPSRDPCGRTVLYSSSH
jgi:hypothetical protein